VESTCGETAVKGDGMTTNHNWNITEGERRARKRDGKAMVLS
jgi:hypothetical protein